MPGPGQYRPDPSEGITRIEDLPQPKVRCQSRNYRRRPCPRCRHSSYRDRLARRTLHDLGNPLTGRPRDIVLIYSQHYCSRCRRDFNADTTDLADPGSHYTRRVVDAAVRLVIEDGLPYRAASCFRTLATAERTALITSRTTWNWQTWCGTAPKTVAIGSGYSAEPSVVIPWRVKPRASRAVWKRRKNASMSL